MKCMVDKHGNKKLIWGIILVALGISGYYFADKYFPLPFRNPDILQEKIPERGNPAWQKAMEELVSKGIIRVGMSAGQVRAAWGEPDRIIPAWKGHNKGEEWLVSFEGYTFDLFFEKGILILVRPPDRLPGP
jgi:hypothetical protein